MECVFTFPYFPVLRSLILDVSIHTIVQTYWGFVGCQEGIRDQTFGCRKIGYLSTEVGLLFIFILDVESSISSNAQ